MLPQVIQNNQFFLNSGSRGEKTKVDAGQPLPLLKALSFSDHESIPSSF